MIESWTLSEGELRVLLAGRGVQEIQGLFLEDAREDRRQALQLLAGMARQRKLVSDGERLSLPPSLDALLHGMAQVGRALVLSSAATEERLCCYCGAECIAVCQTLVGRPGQLRLFAATPEELLALLWEEDWLPAPEEYTPLTAGEEARALWEHTGDTAFSAQLYQNGEPGLCLTVERPALLPPELRLRWPDRSAQEAEYTRESAEAYLYALLETAAEV